MGRMKDLATDAEISIDRTKDLSCTSPIQYVVIDEDAVEIDIDEVNYQLQLAADEARNGE